MSNFDPAISAWRRQMLAAGIKSPALLDELESHLREDVEQGMRSGSTAQAAFETAVQRMGQADVLKAEFKRAGKMNGFSRINHNRLYATVLMVFLITLNLLNLVPTRGLSGMQLSAWLEQGGGKNASNGLLGIYSEFTSGGFERCALGGLDIIPVFFRPWAAALGVFYSLAVGLTLCSRILHPPRAAD
jgi:hypothetical protein